MRRLWRRASRDDGGGVAVAERPAVADEFDGTSDELAAEIERLTAEARDGGDPAILARILRLRHLQGIHRVDADPGAPRFAERDDAGLARAPGGGVAAAPVDAGVPEIPAAALTPGLLRAGILGHGCLLVRGLVGRDDALALAGAIDGCFAERDRAEAGGPPEPGVYEEFVPDRRFGEVSERPWIKEGGGVLALDSPRLTFDVLELLGGAGVPALVAGYLGEPPVISVQKTTLRRAEPSVPGAWHQDGAFLGPVRSLNLWLALSRCGDVAPGLDVVPRRLEEHVATGTDEAVLSYQVSRRVAEEAAAGAPIVRPLFEPGDALLFDEMFLHQTGSDPSMPNPRFALECWFFGPSAFPREFAPIAV
jgi:hypothetical protein